MKLGDIAMPAVLTAGLLFTVGTLEQGVGLFVQTFSSAGAVILAPEPAPAPVRAGALTTVERPVQAGPPAAAATTTPPEPAAISTTHASPTATPSATAFAEVAVTASPPPEVTLPASGAATPTPAASATLAPAATEPATPITSPIAGATAVATPAPSPTATPACPSAGLDLRLGPLDGIVQLTVRGEGIVTLVNAGRAGLPAGASLRLVAGDETSASEALNLMVDGQPLAFDTGLTGWLLPELPAGETLDLTLRQSVMLLKADLAQGGMIQIRLGRQELTAEVVVACGDGNAAIARHKFVVQPAVVEPAPADMKPVEIEPIETKGKASSAIAP